MGKAEAGPRSNKFKTPKNAKSPTHRKRAPGLILSEPKALRSSRKTFKDIITPGSVPDNPHLQVSAQKRLPSGQSNRSKRTHMVRRNISRFSDASSVASFGFGRQSSAGKSVRSSKTSRYNSQDINRIRLELKQINQEARRKKVEHLEVVKIESSNMREERRKKKHLNFVKSIRSMNGPRSNKVGSMKTRQHGKKQKLMKQFLDKVEMESNHSRKSFLPPIHQSRGRPVRQIR